QHRLLAGRDVLAAIGVDGGAVRRQCEQEARGKLLRLRGLYLQTAGDHAALERVVVESLKSFLIIVRHLVALNGAPSPYGYGAVLAAGEALLGPLPVRRAVFEPRPGAAALPAAALRAEFRGYLDEVERIVAALDGLDAA